MGCYINRTSKRPLGNHQKAKHLVDDGDATRYAGETFDNISADECFVCVVNNGPFEAAAVCYDVRELEEFRRADVTKRIVAPGVIHAMTEYESRGEQRPRVWLVMKKETAITLSDNPDDTRRRFERGAA